ncbi:MAG: aspartate--tRNA ligase [Gemmatimonadetes bacterium]|nr:aspartate--tRNA ligase [Gemmatimonadota bacterium]
MNQIDIERTAFRSRMLGGIRSADEGAEVELAGWVHRRRDLGGLVFLDLRDRSGLVQVSLGPDWTDAASLALAHQLGAEDVVAVVGSVVVRPSENQNPDIPTGEIEVRASVLRRLTDVDTPAIPVYRGPEDELPSEELRLKHRVLDLRRTELQENLQLRHRLILACRNYLDRLGFIEVETPILTKPTPEGARDYLVPSRVHHGEFYALPQSPQIYKQLCMVAGFDRYFQIARCFRDEDLRADRQPEFTQIDVEASFVDPDDILGWMEGLMVALAVEAPRIEAHAPFTRMTHAEALERYGTDRPDLRYGVEIQDWTKTLARLDAPVFEAAVAEGGRVRGLLLKGGAALSRKQIEAIEGQAKATGAPGLLWAKRTDDGGSGSLARFMDEEAYDEVGMNPGDLALVAAGSDSMTSPALDAARLAAIEALELSPDREHAWLWVVDFPLFEEGLDGALTANHHPFVMPHPEDEDRLEQEPLGVRGLAYDLVFNGVELGSGSIRNHDTALQRRILRLLGLDDAEIDMKFGFLLNALSSGAPPHGGVAFGVDRLVALFVGAASLREVIGFPTTTAARALSVGAPTVLGAHDLAELGLSLTSPVSEAGFVEEGGSQASEAARTSEAET